MGRDEVCLIIVAIRHVQYMLYFIGDLCTVAKLTRQLVDSA